MNNIHSLYLKGEQILNTKIDFINGNTKKSLFAMTLPLLISMILTMAYNLVDSLWVGNLMGEQGYAALTNSATIVMILSAIAMGTSNGVSILVSQAVGAKQKEKANQIISTALIIALLFSVAITILIYCFLPQILTVLNTPSETFSMAYDYLSIYVAGYFTIYLYMHFTASFRSFGDPLFQVKGMLITTILNAIIDPFFIKLMGLRGAAVATIISEALCLVLAFIYLAKKKYFHVSISFFCKDYLLPIFQNTIPSALQQSMPAISATFMTALVSTFSVTAIAGYGVTSKLEIILFYPAMAMNMALTTIVGQCTGAGRPDRSKDYTKVSILSGSILTIILSVLVIGGCGHLSWLFVQSSAVSTIVKQYLHIVSIGYLGYMITSCLLGQLSGSGHPGKSMFLMFVYYIVVRIPLAYLLVHTSLGLNGVWIAILISHIVAVFAAFISCHLQNKPSENEIQKPVTI